jgi:uncharacterized protein YjiS (DUF1127 family)
MTEMSAIQSDRPVPLGAVTTLRAVALFDRAWASFAAWRHARATERALSELSDGELSDIGLHRGEIATVAERLARGRPLSLPGAAPA